MMNKSKKFAKDVLKVLKSVYKAYKEYDAAQGDGSSSVDTDVFTSLFDQISDADFEDLLMKNGLSEKSSDLNLSPEFVAGFTYGVTYAEHVFNNNLVGAGCEDCIDGCQVGGENLFDATNNDLPLLEGAFIIDKEANS